MRDFVEHADARTGWPTHPLDAKSRDPLYCAYDGAAGAVTAMRILRDAGVDAPDWTGWLPGFLDAWRALPDHGAEPGLQLGEVGILTPAVIASPSDASLASALEGALLRTIGHPAREITAGEAGALHAADALFTATGDARWREAWQRLARSLLAGWERAPDGGQWLWRSEIFGFVRGYYGACHGIAGNVGALLARRDWLEGDDRAARDAAVRTVETLEAGAIRMGEDWNWPVSVDASGTRRLVQWCHGAPGIVTGLANVPAADAAVEARLDRLLTKAGELAWKAGPLAKGGGICHGTAGNGYAFLALFGRLGDPVWLERARAFAMHAIGQCVRARVRYGQGRYTLWTGDGGLAVYLLHCVHPERWAIPGLSVF